MRTSFGFRIQVSALKLTAAFLLLTHAGSAIAWPAFGKHGLIVCGSDIAAQAGIATLKKGGNAADAAVTTAMVMAVTRPYYASLGGGGLMLTRFKNEVNTLDYRERAPHKSTEDMFLKKSKDASLHGGLAVGTPGNVAGLYELHKKYGKLPWSVDVAPAVEIAKRGFMVTEEYARMTREMYGDFTIDAKRYFSNRGQELQVGDILKQPQLAGALLLIQRKGIDGFYKGPVAQDLVKSVQDSGGIMDLLDLADYKVTWRKPLHTQVLGATVYSMPPPSSGGAIMLAELKMAEALKLKEEKPYSAEEYHLFAEIMDRAFFDRQYLADPAFAIVPADQLFSDERIQKWIATIDRKKKTSFDPKRFEIDASLKKKQAGTPGTSGNTTHYVVVDGDGNVVSATTTLNEMYGSGVASEKYGVFLNNEMDDFTTRPGEPNLFGLIQGKANAVAPNKTPLSSMTPTIIEKNDKFYMALGAPGGPKIINGVMQVAYHALTTSKNMDELIEAPRVHHQYKPDKLFYDGNLSPDTVENLEKRGHTLTQSPVARVYGIRENPDGLFEGAFDPRYEGGAAAY